MPAPAGGMLAGLLGKKPDAAEATVEPSGDADVTAAKALRAAIQGGTDEELVEALRNCGCFSGSGTAE